MSTRGCTAQSLARRYERAVEGLAQGQYKVSVLRPGLFRVRKADGTAYLVRSGAGLPVCTCPDWARHGHGHICKHMVLVSMVMEPVAYVGYRTEKGPQVYVVRNGRAEPLHHVVRHSPTGFEWGYGGSGPADLALSILADYLGDEVAAEELKGAFKDEIVARLPHAAWMLTEDALQAFLRRHAVAVPVATAVPAYA